MVKHICVQLPMPPDNVALPAFAAARRVAARLLLTAGPPAVQQSIDISWQPGPTATNPRQRRAATGWDRRTD